MPIVHVNVWEGFGKEKAKIVIQKITKVFVDLGIPQQAVEVIVPEVPLGNRRRTCFRKIRRNPFQIDYARAHLGRSSLQRQQ